MPYAPETDRYPYTPEEVLAAYPEFSRDAVERGAAFMREGSACESYAKGYAQAVGGTLRTEIRLLGAIGSYAKAMGWWRPAKQKKYG